MSDFVTTTTHKHFHDPGGMILCKEEYKKDIDKTIFLVFKVDLLSMLFPTKAVAGEALEK